MAGNAPGLVEPLAADALDRRLDELGALLHACVHAGANVNFVLPYGERDAAAFWRDKVLARVREGGLVLLAAGEDGDIVGTVLLDLDTPPNQAHRAEVSKLLVHPAHRRRGHAKALMAELEGRAREFGRSLITLDTRTGSPAERLYTALGYTTVGIIPGYCRDPFVDRLDPTTVMYKVL